MTATVSGTKIKANEHPAQPCLGFGLAFRLMAGHVERVAIHQKFLEYLCVLSPVMLPEACAALIA